MGQGRRHTTSFISRESETIGSRVSLYVGSLYSEDRCDGRVFLGVVVVNSSRMLITPSFNQVGVVS